MNPKIRGFLRTLELTRGWIYQNSTRIGVWSIDAFAWNQSNKFSGNPAPVAVARHKICRTQCNLTMSFICLRNRFGLPRPRQRSTHWRFSKINPLSEGPPARGGKKYKRAQKKQEELNYSENKITGKRCRGYSLIFRPPSAPLTWIYRIFNSRILIPSLLGIFSFRSFLLRPSRSEFVS